MFATANEADVCDVTRTYQKPPSVQLAYVLGTRLFSEPGFASGNVSDEVGSGLSAIGHLSAKAVLAITARVGPIPDLPLWNRGAEYSTDAWRWCLLAQAPMLLKVRF